MSVKTGVTDQYVAVKPHIIWLSLYTGLFQSISENVPGAGSALDKHIMLLHQELRLGTVVQSQLQQSTLPQTGAVNWTHFGGNCVHLNIKHVCKTFII